MSAIGRRSFLASLAAAVLGGVGVADLAVDTRRPPHLEVETAPVAARARSAGLLPPPPPGNRVPLPGGGVLTALPGDANLLALTLDDGVNSDVVRLYTEFAKDTGIRLTYFVNGVYESWIDHKDLLTPLVESGQIQLGNHTWSHPDLTTISIPQVAEQITRNHRFLTDTYGVDAAPFLRPPYGNHNAGVRAAAADLGYTTTTLWSGSLSDSTLITDDYITQMADKYFTAHSIVIGHLNHMPVTHVYPTLVDIIGSRSLRTVTLNDVFLH